MPRANVRDDSRRRFLKFLLGSPLLASPGLAAWAAQGGPVAPVKPQDPILWAPMQTADLIGSPREAINVFDFEPVARKTIPPAHFGYMASGIDDEVTLRANREGFLKFQLRPRRLVDPGRAGRLPGGRGDGGQKRRPQPGDVAAPAAHRHAHLRQLSRPQQPDDQPEAPLDVRGPGPDGPG